MTREEAIEYLRDPIGKREQHDEAVNMAIKALEQPERKKGKWIATHEFSLFSNPDSITYVCSECGNKIYTVYGTPKTTNFCGKCGADMREEQDG